jgi:hypothetical protein
MKVLRKILRPIGSVFAYVRRVVAAVDARDVALWGGWALMTAGVWRLFGDWALVVGGATLFGVAVFGIASSAPPPIDHDR